MPTEKRPAEGSKLYNNNNNNTSRRRRRLSKTDTKLPTLKIMHLQLPHSLRYPITITKLHVRESEDVDELSPLLDYTYLQQFDEEDETGEDKQVMRKVPGTWQAPTGGKIIKWLVAVGTIIQVAGNDVVDIEEPCSHPVSFENQCVVCGKILDEQNYTSFANPEAAGIKPTHDNTGLLISNDEALRIEEDTKRRLLSSRKLSLVVDLDQTIIHATVDPTVGEWRDDPMNINHDAVKDVQAFQLVDEVGRGMGAWYYVKQRPGLKHFLDTIATMYECHIYTMGTRAYAKEIANIVDPEHKIFGDRILSRDESGSMTFKNLQRLFPVDTKMVVIIDDRGDVWQWSQNLIKVTPYDFFVGIGDINSSFLPKRQDYAAPVDIPKIVVVEEVMNTPGALLEPPNVPAIGDLGVNELKEDTSTLTEQLVSMSGGQDAELIKAQTTRQSEVIAAQLQDRPLARKQEVLDAQDEATDGRESPTQSDDTTSDMETGKRHNLLHDHDTELTNLETALTEVHRTFFDEYERLLLQTKGGRLAEVRTGGKGPIKPPSRKSDAFRIVPDIKHIMPSMKRRVFDNLIICFSGLIPLGVDVQSSDLAQQAKSFGGIVVEGVSSAVTHLIAAKSRTQKVRSAAVRFPNIKIVSPEWFRESISAWGRLDETPYLISIHPEDRMYASSPIMAPSSVYDELEDAGLLSSEDDDADGESKDIPIGLLPGEEARPMDASNLDWGEMEDELADFMGSEAGDTDLESMNGDDESFVTGGVKRNRSATPPPDTDEEVVEKEKVLTKSPLSKRRKLARERNSALSIVTLQDGGMPSPRSEVGDSDELDDEDDSDEEEDFDIDAAFE